MKRLRTVLRNPTASGMVPFYMLLGPALALLGVLLIVLSQLHSFTPLLLAGHHSQLRVSVRAPEAPPTRAALGRGGWTLIHSVAANYPAAPSALQRDEAAAFFRALSALYPCATCRDHFERFVALQPPDVASRERLLLWTCRAHNAVNVRNGKPPFPCTIKELDRRWGDCGCSSKSAPNV